MNLDSKYKKLIGILNTLESQLKFFRTAQELETVLESKVALNNMYDYSLEFCFEIFNLISSGNMEFHDFIDILQNIRSLHLKYYKFYSTYVNPDKDPLKTTINILENSLIFFKK